MYQSRGNSKVKVQKIEKNLSVCPNVRAPFGIGIKGQNITYEYVTKYLNEFPLAIKAMEVWIPIHVNESIHLIAEP